MDARRVTAIAALGLIGAVVVGLVATSGDDDTTAAPAATSDTPVETAATVATPVAGNSSAITIDTTIDTTTTAPSTTVDPNVPELPDRGPHPEFLPVQQWLQTDATSFDDFDGQVVAVQFWTFGCNNCQATFPHMRDLYAKYGGENFEIVGVHAPEFDDERDVDAIAEAAQENDLTWPIAVDNEKLNFRSWQDRRFWPRLYLLDRNGHIRYDHIGEGAYDDIDAAVGALIAEGQA